MNVSQLINEVNNLTDEGLPPEQVVGFLNDAMAKVNAEVDANFPYFDLTNQTYEPPFSEKWQRLLLVTFASGRIKQMDSSQFEYEDLYGQFYNNLVDFTAKYTVPDEYKDADSSKSTQPNFTDHYYSGGW